MQPIYTAEMLTTKIKRPTRSRLCRYMNNEFKDFDELDAFLASL